LPRESRLWDSRTLNELAFHILGKKAVGNLSINLFLHFSILKLFDRLEWDRLSKMDKIGVGSRLLLHLNISLVQTKSKRSSNLRTFISWKRVSELWNPLIPATFLIHFFCKLIRVLSIFLGNLPRGTIPYSKCDWKRVIYMVFLTVKGNMCFVLAIV